MVSSGGDLNETFAINSRGRNGYMDIYENVHEKKGG